MTSVPHGRRWLEGRSAIVFGGASGLGAASARALHEAGAVVTVADIAEAQATDLAAALGHPCIPARVDVTNDADVEEAVAAAQAQAPVRAAVVCAGIGHAERVVGKTGPHARHSFERTVAVNLLGTFNAVRFTASAMSRNEPDARGERGVIILTASVASFDGQAGQIAYAGSKAAIAGMVLPAARDLASHAIRVCAIAPGTFETPLLESLPKRAREGLAQHMPFPRRPGQPREFADLALHIVANQMLNGEVIRLDGALRMPAL